MLNTCAVTLAVATTQSPIDASLVPNVNRNSDGSCLWRPHCPPDLDSSNACSVGADVACAMRRMRHVAAFSDREGMLHLLLLVILSMGELPACTGVEDLRG